MSSGLSRELQMSEYYLTSSEHRESAKLPVRWMSPEAIKAHKFSEKSDVWSFAVVCHEIFTFGQVPYPAWTNEHILDEVRKGQRLPPPCGQPALMPAELARQLDLCFLADPNERPAFAELAKQLRRIVDADQDNADAPRVAPRVADPVAGVFNSAESPYAVTTLRPRSASVSSVGTMATVDRPLGRELTWDSGVGAVLGPETTQENMTWDSGDFGAVLDPATTHKNATAEVICKDNGVGAAEYILASAIDAATVAIQAPQLPTLLPAAHVVNISCKSGPTVTIETLVRPVLVLEADGDGDGGRSRESALL